MQQYNQQQQQQQYWNANMMPPTQQLQQYSQHAPPPQQPYYYGGAAAANGGGGDGAATLWIGGLQYWMDESYLNSCFYHTAEFLSAKVIRNKQTGQSEGYGFLEFKSRASAENALQNYNGTMMPNAEQSFRLNWASHGAGEKHSDESPEFTIFVGDLAADVTDYVLQETFKSAYPSVKGAKVVMDKATGRPKGYGFVKFGDEMEQQRAMNEMNGFQISTRAIRTGPAADKRPFSAQTQRASYQNPQGNSGESDPNNTTVFVGGLDPNVMDENLKQVFSQCGEVVHVRIPVGKRCGFVQFSDRSSAERAIASLNGIQLGGQSVRLSWGHGLSKQQTDQNQSGAPQYGYNTQGYEGYGGYAPPPQDPNTYFGNYPGYANYQQQQYHHPQQ